MNARLQPFRLLRDPSRYMMSTCDLRHDDDDRAYWVAYFKRHLSTVLKLAIESALARGADAVELNDRGAACRTEYDATFDRFDADPVAAKSIVGIIMLDRWRDSILRKHGFVDAFFDLKNRENEKMLPLLPAVCHELDQLHGIEQLRAVIAGVFAGNIFDMGAEATAKQFLGRSPDFFNTRARLPDRPWLIDDYDLLQQKLLATSYRKCVFFIDNAGSDFLLGALPLIRWLGKRGTRVVIAANERPTLNDMTIDDIAAWWPRILASEPSLAQLPIVHVSTGTGEPMIDLAEVSADLNHASEDADLVVLEGMGRGIESNLAAEFICDALNIAMLKDPRIAQQLGGKIFDLVCRFR